MINKISLNKNVWFKWVLERVEQLPQGEVIFLILCSYFRWESAAIAAFVFLLGAESALTHSATRFVFFGMEETTMLY